MQRDKGWNITKFPCFSLFFFLHFDLANSPVYLTILNEVKKGNLFLDLGCCLGQDIRRLVYDGAPSENTFGIELEQQLIELGYDLFRDRGDLHTKFIAQDFLEDTSELSQLSGKIRFLNSGYFLHLWDWDGQIRVVKRMIKLLVPEAGALITGVSYGSLSPGEWALNPHGGRPMFVHDNHTFSRMWDQIGSETNTKWEVCSELEVVHGIDGIDDMKKDGHSGRLQRWVVERL